MQSQQDIEGFEWNQGNKTLEPLATRRHRQDLATSVATTLAAVGAGRDPWVQTEIHNGFNTVTLAMNTAGSWLDDEPRGRAYRYRS